MRQPQDRWMPIIANLAGIAGAAIWLAIIAIMVDYFLR